MIRFCRTHSLILLTLLTSSLLSANAQTSPPSDDSFDHLPTAPKPGNGAWSGSFGLGMTLSRGNDNGTQTSLTADMTRAGARTRTLAHGVFLRAFGNGSVSSDNQLATLRHERNIAQDWFGFVDATYEREPLQDLMMRQTFSSGLGYRFLNTDTESLNVYSGLAYSIEHNRGVDNAHGTEMQIGNDYSYRFTEHASFTQRLLLTPITIGRGGVRSVLELGLNTHIAEGFGLQLSLLNKYQEHAPSGKRRMDSIIFTGITSSF